MAGRRDPSAQQGYPLRRKATVLTRLTMRRGDGRAVAFVAFPSDRFLSDRCARPADCQLREALRQQPFGPAAEGKLPQPAEARAVRAVAKAIRARAALPCGSGGGADAAGAFEGGKKASLTVESPAIPSTSLRTGVAAA